MRKKIIVSALLLALPLFLTACTVQELPVIGPVISKFFPAKTEVQSSVTLTMWGLWENPEVTDVLIKKFQEENPNITITYEDRSVLKPGEYKDNVYTRVKEQNAPDIVLIHNSWVPYLKDSLSSMPSNLMSAEDYSSRFYPSATQQGLQDSAIYAVPAYYDGLMMVYNKNHFDEINQLDAPSSWEEFRSVAKTLTRYDEKNKELILRAGAAIGTADNISFFSDILGLMFAQAAVAVPDNIDSKSAQDALAFYTNFSLEDKIWDATFPEASLAFVQERVSIVFVPSWGLLDILEARPDLKVGVAQVPQPPIPNPVSWGTFWMYSVPSNSANKDAAWKFVNFMSQESQQQMLYSEASKFRQFGSLYSLKSLSSQVAADSYLKPLVDSAPFSKISPLADRAGNDRVVDLLKTAVNYIVKDESKGDKNPTETALKKVKSDLYTPTE